MSQHARGCLDAEWRPSCTLVKRGPRPGQEAAREHSSGNKAELVIYHGAAPQERRPDAAGQAVMAFTADDKPVWMKGTQTAIICVYVLPFNPFKHGQEGCWTQRLGVKSKMRRARGRTG